MSRLLYLVPVRVLAAVAVTAVFSLVWRMGPDDGGANIGAGLLLFATIWAGCLVWSLFDARRHGFAISLTAWSIVALVIGAGFPFSIALIDGEWDSEILRTDLAVFIPMMLFSMVPLAAVGAAVGQATRKQA
ncbi:hypothetical protein NODU109028_15275 [Nocardioides dubius]|uniref:ABC transporter permease n=1 Tax=Nocardioides dubius TaxID=317019 RepID=A0ABN1U4B3_9ACTN